MSEALYSHDPLPAVEPVRLLSFLIKATDSSVWEYDLESGVMSWSRPHYQLYGLESGVLPNFENWARRIHPADRVAFIHEVKSRAESGQAVDTRLRVLHKFKGTRWFHIKAELFDENVDGHSRMVGVSADVTSSFLAGEIIRRDEEKLDKLLRSRGEELRKECISTEKARRKEEERSLAEIMANELRNPLAALRLAIFNLKKRIYTPFNYEQFEHIDRKLDESSRAIENLITYLNIDMPVPGEIELAPVVEKCARERAQAHPRSRVSVSSSLQSISGIRVNADSRQVELLFSHLFDNAFEAVDKRGRIEVTGGISADGVSVRIADNGAGIPRENIEKVFVPLFTTKTKGAGLGLPICRQIVSMHNGTIDIKSAKGKGTAVTVFFPLDPSR